MPKYSIILPVYNSVKYIRDSVNTVLSNDYNDFEFIISNNCSTDGTEEYLNTINDHRVKIIKPDETLPLGAHWNFAIKHATGDWLWAMGADDGMMPYFFELCDKLVEICKNKNINIIKSNRAYYFWPGCEIDYGDSHIKYQLNSEYKIKKTYDVMNSMLEGKYSYFDIPQMYVSSLFSRKLINKVVSHSKTNDIIPYNVPAQDAYLGVFACVFETKYLFIDVPLGWVGTSPAGFHYKAIKHQLMYKDCTYNTLAVQVKSLLFIIHLAFLAFYENSDFKTNKFSKKTSYIEILSKVFYHDLINLPIENTRVQTFFAYLTELFIDKEIIIKKAEKMKRRDKITYIIHKILDCKLNQILKRMYFKVVKKLYKQNIENWSIYIKNTSFITYEQINSLLKSEQHVINILDLIKV